MSSRADDVRARLRRSEGGGLRTFMDGPEPIVWERGAGAHVWDADGRRYLDLNGAFAAATLGHCHPRVTEAIRAQAGILTHCPSAAPSALRADLYDRLLALAPPSLTRVLPAVTGSQANELAITLARAATGRRQVVAFAGGYLGRSLGSVGLAGKHAYRAQLGVEAGAAFLPYPDPYRAPWAGDRDPAEAALALLADALADPASGLDPVACVVVEPMQGNGGAVAPDDRFLQGLRRLCDEAGALLVLDEIQCGFGRTGRVWACEHAGVEPDLMTVGKGIGGGLAIGAVLGTEAVMATWRSDVVTTTFLTNALNLAAACAAIDVFREERLEQRAAALGATALRQLRDGLADVPGVGDVRGRGLLLGIELVSDRALRTPDPERAAAVAGVLRAAGILVGRSGRHGNVVKLCPPLVIDEDDLVGALATLIEVIAS